MGMAYQTMTNPDFIYEREEVVDGKVRKKNIYAKAYIHRDYYFVLSIVALFDKDGKSCISSHMVNLNNGLNQAKKYGRMIYIKKGLFDNLDLNTEDFEFKNFIKGKESLTKYQNKKYPSPNLMTDTQLFDFRFRQKFDIEYFVKKEKCFENFENLILDKFKLRHNYNEDFLSRINYYMESYIFENLYDAIELMHNSKEFVENLKDIRKDLEETFSEDVKNLNDWQIYDLYEGLVYEIALKQIKEYKDRVIKNPKSIDSRLETINRIFSISTSKEK